MGMFCECAFTQVFSVDMSALRICTVSGEEFMTKHCFTGGNLNPAMPGISNLNMQI